MKLRMFNIICKGEPNFKIGEKLVLEHTIERGDYVELSNGDYNTRKEMFLNGLADIINFFRGKGNEVDNFKKSYLVITTKNFTVKGFIRL